MQALHDDYDGVIALVVEARQQRLVEPVIHVFPGGFGLAVGCLDRIVDDDDRTAATGQGAADRCVQPIAALRRAHFILGILARIDAHQRKEGSVPVALDHTAAAVGIRRRQAAAIGNTDDALVRLMAEQPGGESDRGV